MTPNGRVRTHAELRIGGDRCLRMARHLDFRHHHHLTLGGVGHDFAHIVLRVETAVLRAVEHALRGIGHVRPTSVWSRHELTR
jgi:hypothetical protein